MKAVHFNHSTYVIWQYSTNNVIKRQNSKTIALHTKISIIGIGLVLAFAAATLLGFTNSNQAFVGLSIVGNVGVQ